MFDNFLEVLFITNKLIENFEMFVARSFRRKNVGFFLIFKPLNVSGCDQAVANFACLVFMFISFRVPISVWQTIVTGSPLSFVSDYFAHNGRHIFLVLQFDMLVFHYRVAP